MTARYVLTLQARRDLAEIAEYVAAESGPELAGQVIEKMREGFRLVAGEPGVGHVRADLSEDPTVRFWPVFSYLIAYAHEEQPLGIVCIVHGTRDPHGIGRHLRRAREGRAQEE